MGIGLLALQTDTLFTPAPKLGPEFLSIYLIWITFSDHMDFAAREPKSIFSMQNTSDHVVNYIFRCILNLYALYILFLNTTS